MKIRNIALVLIMALVLSTFSGCGLRQLEARVDAVEDAVENRADKVEDKLENAVESAVYGSSAPKAEKAQPAAKFEPALSAQDAESIALEHAGLSAEQVRFLHSEYEIDDGIKQYDVNFHQDRLEYEYSINADSGEIISFEMDR